MSYQLLHRCSAAVVDIAVSPLGHLIYFATTSCAGWGLLAALTVRAPNRRPRGIDMLFTAVSAATVSSMSAAEMEVFSDGQLVVLTVLMLSGGEVFLSFLGLVSKLMILRNDSYQPVPATTEDPPSPRPPGDAEAEDPLRRGSPEASRNGYQRVPPTADHPDPPRRRDAVCSLVCIVLAILLVANVGGAAAVAAYIYAAPGARWTLSRKSLGVGIFAVFTTVSTFANCGFVPTNENMMVFSRDLPLLVLLAALALVGNTLFPQVLAACVHVVWRLRPEEPPVPMMIPGETTGYDHLLPPLRCRMLAATVAFFIAMQAALLCGMEWGGALRGLSAVEKVVNAVSLAVNSRHTGESTLDLSTLAPAVVVLMM
ncbi:probable cation transporter HKT7 [Panicum virgatum]|nr:probable cation transporter HKT7 [Panicum virgatum]